MRDCLVTCAKFIGTLMLLNKLIWHTNVTVQVYQAQEWQAQEYVTVQVIRHPNVTVQVYQAP